MKTRQWRYPVFLFLLSLLFAGLAQAQVHKCKDEHGAVVFQDRPCLGAAIMVGETAAQNDAAATAKHFFWQASAGKGTLYLLGSIHFGTAQMYPLPAIMSSSFKQADALVVEADVLNVDPTALAGLVAEKAMYRDGTTLRQQLPAQTWARLQTVSAKLGMPVELLYQQKPWFVSMGLTALALNKLGFSEEKGIDAHFLSLAQGKKRIIELEGMEWQLSLFDQLTQEEQVMMLEETLREIDDGKVFFDKMLAFWQAGDADGIQSMFDEGFVSDAGSDRLNRLIMTDRNKRMTEKLHRMAEQGGRYFVVVGAGHLAGAEGIVALLKQRGYQIEQR